MMSGYVGNIWLKRLRGFKEGKVGPLTEPIIQGNAQLGKSRGNLPKLSQLNKHR